MRFRGGSLLGSPHAEPARALDPAAELDGDLMEVMRDAPGGRRSYGELL
jgi:hypothetical protein